MSPCTESDCSGISAMKIVIAVFAKHAVVVHHMQCSLLLQGHASIQTLLPSFYAILPSIRLIETELTSRTGFREKLKVKVGLSNIATSPFKLNDVYSFQSSLVSDRLESTESVPSTKEDKTSTIGWKALHVLHSLL